MTLGVGVLENDGIYHFDNLLRDLQSSQEILSNVLSNLSNEEFNEVVKTSRGKKPRWQHIRGLHWHEAYHLGQLELLRSFIFFHYVRTRVIFGNRNLLWFSA